MGAFFIYIFKSAVCLTLFYLFFRLLLSKETFHRFNRIALLGVLCLSWLIPCIEVTTHRQIEVSQALLSIEQLLMMAESTSATVVAADVDAETTAISWIQVVLLVYLAGILFFACRNVFSLVSLVKLLLSGKRERLEKGVTLVTHGQDVAPFSWMKFIVISQKDLEENGREILIHETAHIQNRHSIDLLIADICIFFQWFNPAAWLLKQELQNIHEYEADETVINKGINAKDYQLLLIKKAVGTRLYSMANSFNHSKLKKRITMMLKEKSSPWARLKYLYVLPLAAVAVAAFARPEVSKTVEEISAVKVNDLTAIVEVENKQKVVNVPTDTAVIVVKGYKNVVEDSIFTVSKGRSTVSLHGIPKDAKPLIFVNGKESDLAVVDALNPERIQTMSALTTESATKKYGDIGKNGAIEIVLLPEGQFKKNLFTDSEKDSNSIVTGLPINIRGLQDGVKPLVVIDGVSVEEDALSKISLDRIKNFSVLKDKSSMAIAIYGEKGKNGVILVHLFTEDEYQARKSSPAAPYNNALEMGNNLMKDYISAKKMVLFIDGKEVSAAQAEKMLAKDVRRISASEGKEKETLNIYITSEKNPNDEK